VRSPLYHLYVYTNHLQHGHGKLIWMGFEWSCIAALLRLHLMCSYVLSTNIARGRENPSLLEEQIDPLPYDAQDLEPLTALGMVEAHRPTLER
jgi:hypothetical protein